MTFKFFRKFTHLLLQRTFVLDTVLNFTNTSKEDLYKRAKNWVVSTIRTSDKTVIFDDKDFNEIRTDATLALPVYQGATVNFKISIFFKENRCKIVYESFMYHYVGLSGIEDSAFEKLKGMYKGTLYKDFDKQFEPLRDSLFKALSTANNSNW